MGTAGDEGGLVFPSYYWSWLLTFVGAMAFFLLRRSYGAQGKKSVNLPPGPCNWPLIGAFPAMEPLLHKSFNKLAAKYGPVVYFRLGVQNVVVVSSSEIAEEVLKHKDGQFADRAAPMTRTTAKYMGLESSILPFSNYNAQLKLVRKIAISEFLTVAKIKSYQESRSREMAVMVKKIFSTVKNSKTGGSRGGVIMDMKSVTTDMVQNILFSLVLGVRWDGLPPTDRRRKFSEMQDELQTLFMKINLVDFFPFLEWLDPQGLMKSYKNYGQRQREFYSGVIEDQRKVRKLHGSSGSDELNSVGEGNSNFLDALLSAQEQGAKISEKGVMGALFTILEAGIDTTSTVLDWAMLELVRHPEILRRLQEEIDTVIGKERPLDEADLETMPFLDAVAKETLRLHAALPSTFPHVNFEPSTLGGYDIPANTAVFVNIYSIARDPKYWTDPLRFNPDRFMHMAQGGSSSPSPSHSQSRNLSGSDFHLLPFGSGRRVCAGFNLAMVMILHGLGTLVHAFDWAPLPGLGIDDFKTDEIGTFVLRRKHPLSLSFKPRVSHDVYKSDTH